MVNRRRMIKLGGLWLVAAASTSGCQSLISNSRNLTSTLGDQITRIGINKVFDLFVEFIGNLDIDSSQNFGSWFSGLRPNDQAAVSKMEEMLDRAGFNARRSAVLKIPGGTCIYGVENKDGFNLCAPCYTPSRQVQTPMVEGNVLSGLLLASKSPELRQLVRASGTSLARVLVPVQAYQEPSCNLYQSSTEPWRYSSSDANIEIEYKYDSIENKGMVQISIDNNKFSFEDYTVLNLPRV